MLAPQQYGLLPSEEDAFLEALTQSHSVRITISILDRDEVVIGSITPKLLAGAVQVDTSGDVSRSLTATFLDPNNQLHFDSGNPAAGALYADNFISVKYGVQVESLGNRWVDVPVFWGILTKFSRTGPSVDLEAQGKESLAMDPHFVVGGFNLRRGMKVSAAIRNVMARVGERRFAVDEIEGRLHHTRSVVRGEQFWQVLVGGSDNSNFTSQKAKYRKAHLDPSKGLLSKATNGSFIIFYNGLGYLTAKPKRQNKAVFTIKDGKHLVSIPTYEYDTLSFINHADVTGGKHKKGNAHFHGSYTLPAANPLSPYALQRNGKGRFMTVFFQSDTLRSDAACAHKAKTLVNQAAFEGLTASFDCMPIPILEEGDLIRLYTETFELTFVLDSFTIPLTTDSPMNVGWNGRASLPQGRVSF